MNHKIISIATVHFHYNMHFLMQANLQSEDYDSSVFGSLLSCLPQK